MKNLLQHLFTLSMIFIAFSFSLSVHAQNNPGPPPVRPESRGGGTQDDQGCQLVNNGEDQLLKVCFKIDDIAYLDGCSLNVGYNLINSDIIYVDANSSNWSQDYFGVWSFCFYINYSGDEIADMCDQNKKFLQFDFYCLENGVYTPWYQEPLDPMPIDVCCDGIPDDPDNQTGNGNGNLTRNNATKIYNHAKPNEEVPDYKLDNELIFTDYYVFDINGNLLSIIKNKLLTTRPQEYISELKLRSGIYIVKYWDGQKMTTDKVYNFE